jgi:hypothetical protein
LIDFFFGFGLSFVFVFLGVMFFYVISFWFFSTEGLDRSTMVVVVVIMVKGGRGRRIFSSSSILYIKATLVSVYVGSAWKILPVIARSL